MVVRGLIERAGRRYPGGSLLAKGGGGPMLGSLRIQARRVLRRALGSVSVDCLYRTGMVMTGLGRS